MSPRVSIFRDTLKPVSIFANISAPSSEGNQHCDMSIHAT